MTRGRQVLAGWRARRRSSMSYVSVRLTLPRQSPLETWHLPRALCSIWSGMSQNGRRTSLPERNSSGRTPACARSSWCSADCPRQELATPGRSSGHSSRRSWTSGTLRDRTVASRTPISCGNASPSPGSKCAILPTAVSGYLRAKAPPERRPEPDNFASSLRRFRLRVEPPSSSGRGHRPFKAETRVRIPLGVLSAYPEQQELCEPRTPLRAAGVLAEHSGQLVGTRPWGRDEGNKRVCRGRGPLPPRARTTGRARASPRLDRKSTRLNSSHL